MARPYVLEHIEALEQGGSGGGGDAIAVIPTGTDIPIKDRHPGRLYFKVTSAQTSVITSQVKVSPNMGLLIR